MGNSSFFNNPVAYDVIDEGAQGNGFYEGGDAFEKIDPVKIRDFVAEADASAAASEASHQASQVSANASAASAAAAHTSEVNAAASAAAALANKNSTDTNATTATTKAAAASTSAAAALASQGAAATSETNAAASATAANTSKVNAGTSETNAAASAAAALASKNAAATSETNAGNSATAAAGSATAANTSKVNAGTSETNAAGSATTATTQAGIATTKAGQAATSATNAGTSETNALASKNAAATSATNAGTSETNALASKNAAATSASNALTSEGNALSSKNAAATSASNALTSEGNALSSKNAAATSATNAATSEGNALTYKNAANTSAGNAATSETNAANSATAAAGSATSALGSLNSFKGVYYGALASDPTLDPLGAAMSAGDLYWNTTSNTLKIYTGSVWNAYASSGGLISSVFGRTGAVVAVSGDYTFAQIGSKPTTISGYGITDSPTASVTTPLVDGAAAVGLSATYARADHVHPTDTSRAPFEAMALRNLVYNGAMEIDLINAGGLTGGTGLALNEWQVSKNGSMLVNAQQTTGDTPPGFINALTVTCVTGSALAAGDYVFIHTAIENSRVAFMQFGSANAQSLTLGFWIKAHRNNSYSGSLRNAASNRSYPFGFTINAADTWEYKTITIPGDTAGTWAGWDLSITMAAGTTYQGTSGAWASANLLGATSTTNGVAASTDVMKITGVSVLPGSATVSAASSPQLRRPYDVEYLLCKLNTQWQTYTGSAAFASGSGTFVMRFKQIGKTFSFVVRLTCTATGNLSYIPVPIGVAASGQNYTVFGREIARTGIVWFLQVNQANQLAGGTYSNGVPAMNTGDVIDFAGTYETV